jgi:hypothetical protein
VIEPGKPRVAHLELSEWPIWARVISKFRRQGNVGVGDTVVHLIGDERSKRFQTWFKRKVGRTCGCAERQQWLNLRYPYSLL